MGLELLRGGEKGEDTGYMGDGTFYNIESCTACMHNEMNTSTKIEDGTL